MAAEYVEKAYIRDSITAKQYEPACRKLIGQFRTARDAVKGWVPDVEQFMRMCVRFSGLSGANRA